MLNMNSPVVQNMMQSGYNPYGSNVYNPQQPTYSDAAYGYNPYLQAKANGQIQEDEEQLWEDFYYDPMPKVIVNEARGIRAGEFQQQGYYNNGYQYNNNQYFNYNPFNGYMNPIFQ